MSCCHPLKAFKTGYKTENGKDDYVIASYSTCETLSLERCKKPVLLGAVPHTFINGHAYLTDPIDIPCGVCVGCRMEHAKQWKIRNCLEWQSHKEAYFVTLTYDDGHLPINELGQPMLVKRHLQLFMKRLRKNVGNFRYFACGEYGSNTHRSHYHILLYGHLSGFELVGVNKFTCPDVARCWPYGQHIIEEVTPGSIAYVSRYCVDKQKDPAYIDYPVKPFITMSRKPGIGMLYFVENYDSIKETKRVYGLFGEGSKNLVARMPTSFKRNLEGIPWFESFREFCRAAGEKYEDVLKVVYGTKDRWRINDMAESLLYEKLERINPTEL